MDALLGSYSPGRFRKIKVLRRGVSPRIVRARVYGTRGRRAISGPTLRTRLNLRDIWARFTRVSTSRVSQARMGGLRALGIQTPRRVLAGVFEPRPRKLVLQRRGRHRRWRALRRVTVLRDGRYAVRLGRAGVYRVRSGSIAGPSVRVG